MVSRVSGCYLLILIHVPALPQDVAASGDASTKPVRPPIHSPLLGVLSALGDPFATALADIRQLASLRLLSPRPTPSIGAIYLICGLDLAIQLTRFDSLIGFIDRDHILATSLLSVIFRLRSGSESTDCARERPAKRVWTEASRAKTKSLRILVWEDRSTM
jgi:hypothetical protein